MDLDKELAQLKSLDPSKKILIISILFLLLFFGFSLGFLSFNSRNKPTQPPAPTPPANTKENIQPLSSPIPKPKALLTIDPATKTVKKGETFPVSIRLSGEPVQAVDIVLNYDPEFLKPSNIKNGELFPSILQRKIEQNKISFSAAVNPQKPEPVSSGEIFSVSLTALKATDSASLTFDPLETIAGKNGENFLGNVVGGNFKIE